MTIPVLLAWSAPDEIAERALRDRIADRLAVAPPAAVAAELRDLLDHTHPVRGTQVTGSAATVRRIDERPPRPVALLLPGHGSQYLRMGCELYGAEPALTGAMDAFFAAYGAGGQALRADWLSADPEVGIDEADRGQPLLFALGYALTQTLRSWGISPAALIGHSVGEFAAAAVAGVVEFPLAARLMAARVPHYRGAVRGGLLAVAAPADTVAAHLVGGAVIGVINSPGQTMVSGIEQDLAGTADRLRGSGYTCLRARIPVPFHSPLLDPLGVSFARYFDGVALSAPRIPIYSTRTGLPVTAAQATDPRFWAGQVGTPVLFWAALDALLTGGDHLLVEVGPGRALTGLARRHPAVLDGRSAAVAALPARAGSERTELLRAAARLWTEGHPVDLSAVHNGSGHRPLPAASGSSRAYI